MKKIKALFFAYLLTMGTWLIIIYVLDAIGIKDFPLKWLLWILPAVSLTIVGYVFLLLKIFPEETVGDPRAGICTQTGH